MKKLILALFLVNTVASAQHVLSERLQNAIKSSKQFDQEFSVRIEMLDKVDAFELHNSYIQDQTPLQQRALNTVKALKEKANQSQRDILNSINLDAPDSFQKLRKYWIVNHIYLEASKELIYKLGKRKDVAFIDLNTDTVSPLEPELNHDTDLKSSNAIEPGLIAINAPALWELGYTGKGLLVYDYDTGVCPDHPAFKNRFLANHFPMSQSWYGHFVDFPNESNSNHGTHTLGTIIGEGLPSGDTIGVAPGAYWMACDLVTSTVAALPSLENIVAAYEWALDSDGNSETTLDIPDVINNSWRWNDDPDTVHCNDYIKDLMNALEAVGIASVFSGGNAGPDNTTISAPQRINTTIVNTFSVGSVNANQMGNPISYFSSRGPLQCPATDSSLLIHPEVVAPGHDVRSAVGINAYATKSGTSMAAPHVSGAVLLLKEAFPELSGAEILTALYFTANDLGEPGEDNTYGMGIIDCLAAYEYLSLSHTPTDPTAQTNDLVVQKIHEPSSVIFCNSSVNPNFDILNNGYETIDSMLITITLNGELIEETLWYGSLLPGEILNHSSTDFNITEIDSIEHELHIRAIVPHWEETDLYNNSLTQRFNYHTTVPSPFIETFEFEDINQSLWTIINSDGEDTWEIDEASGLENSFNSIKMPFFVYGNLNQRDLLLSPNISISEDEDYYLSFNYAHQHRDTGGRKDSLLVEVSFDCGNTYHKVFEKGGDDLTTTDTLDMNFEPLHPTHWASEYIPLSEINASANQVQLKFTAINGKQNNLYIDNITVAKESEFSTLELNQNLLVLAPNPASDYIRLKWIEKGSKNIQIALIDVRGQILEERYFENQNKLVFDWNLSDFDPGYYFFRCKSENKITSKSFIIQ